MREPQRGGRQRCRQGLVVGRQVRYSRGRRGTGHGGGWVCRGVIRSRWQEPHEVEAAGVKARVMPRPHHQDLLGVVVQSGDTSRHADSEGNPGHADGDREEEEGNCQLVLTHLCRRCVAKYILGPFRLGTQRKGNKRILA